MCFSYKGLYSQMRRGVIALASGVTVSKGSEFYARTHTPEIVYLMVYKTNYFRRADDENQRSTYYTVN